MARVLPPQLPEGLPRSERTVYDAFLTLPDPWLVLVDIPVGIFGRPRPGLEQIDFLLVHPRLGLGIIEVKGGKISIREGEWFTTPHGSTTPRPLGRSPFKQAADQRFELQRFLWKRLRIRDDAMAHGVALPDCHVSGPLGPDAPTDLVIDASGLAQPLAAVERVMRRWRSSANLSAEDLERLVALLKPTLSLTIVLAAQVAQIEKALERETRRQVDFSESQFEAYRLMLRCERALVFGEAGTGKTVLAVERARRLVETGSRTLLLCHRAGVLAAIRTLAADLSPTRQFDPRSDETFVLTHWTGLRQALESAGRLLPELTSRGLPDAMLKAADDLGLLRFDAIVIDEGQEFTPGQIEGLAWLLNEPEDGPLYVFADPFQHSGLFTAGGKQMRGTYEWKVPLEMRIVALVDNVRNSKPIADAAGSFLLDQRSRSVVEGRDPEIHRLRRRQDVVTRAADRLARLLGEERFRANQLLAVLTGIGEEAFVRELQRRRLHGVSVTEISRFPLTSADLRIAYGLPDHVQGLEAEIVVLIDWDDRPMSIGRVRDLYVAMSRARSHLVVFSNRDLDELEMAAGLALQASAVAAEEPAVDA
jgi:nuclease-like protein